MPATISMNADGSPAADPAQETSAPEPAAQETEPWDGSFDSIDKRPWWGAIPEGEREHVLAPHKKATYLDGLLNSDDVAKSLREALSSVEKERDEARKWREEHEPKIKGLESRVAEHEADREFARLKSAYAEIMDDVHFLDEAKTKIDPNKGAWVKFMDLLERGVPEEDAARAARAWLPEKPATQAPQAAPAKPAERDVAPPRSVQAMGRPGTPPAGTTPHRDPETFEAAVARMRAKAEAEE